VLAFFVEETMLDVLCVSEHWLKNLEIEYYSKIYNLRLVSAFCREERENGGTAIYVKEGLNSKNIDMSNHCTELDIEVCGVELVESQLIILSVYRSPCGNIDNFMQSLDMCLRRFLLCGKKVLVCGDVNIHLETTSIEESNLANLLTSYGLHISSRLPTRMDACIDIAATNIDTWDYQLSVVEPMVADHSALVVVNII